MRAKHSVRGGVGNRCVLCFAGHCSKIYGPTVAALLMSMESVFSAICGVVFLKERFTLKEFIGILFIIAAIIVAQLPKKEKTHENAYEKI